MVLDVQTNKQTYSTSVIEAEASQLTKQAQICLTPRNLLLLENVVRRCSV